MVKVVDVVARCPQSKTSNIVELRQDDQVANSAFWALTTQLRQHPVSNIK